MDKKIIIIVSSQDVLYQNIATNLGHDFCEIKTFKDKNSIEEFTKNPFKIDVLIIDDITQSLEWLVIYARNVFSFSDIGIKPQMLISKPLMLSSFLVELYNAIESKKIFVYIDGNIYCEVRSSFVRKDASILKLSHTENAVLKHILLAKDFYLSKASLQENVWKYSKEAETTTIEQSMKKLRSLLPNGLLEPYEKGYKLLAQKIY